MLITCPNCATSYEVQAESLTPAGRSVRCGRCQEVWFATAVHEPAVADGWGLEDEAPDAEPAWPETLPEDTAEQPRADAEPPAEAETLEEVSWDEALAEQQSHTVEQQGQNAATGIIEPVVDAPSLVPDGAFMRQTDPDPSLSAAPIAEDIETVAARRQRAQARSAARWNRWKKRGLIALIVLLACAHAAVIVWRRDVVGLLPQTASLFAAIGLPVNLRGLEFADIKVARQQHEGVSVLIVEGLIVNVVKAPVEVPRLRLSIRNSEGTEIYNWTVLPTRSILPAGESLSFLSRLASPPADGHDVQVRFFNRHDLAAATR